MLGRWRTIMKACGYCGRENEDSATFCVECGTAFEEKVPPEQEQRIPGLPLAKRLHELNAWSATAILLACLASHVICAILVALVAVLSLKDQSSYPVGRFESAIHTAMPTILSCLRLFRRRSFSEGFFMADTENRSERLGLQH
jgi:hypothetical protein